MAASRVWRVLFAALVVAFAGGFLLNLFYVGYFGFVARHVRNTLVFGVWTGITICLLLAYMTRLRRVAAGPQASVVFPDSSPLG
jgi:hypothetical protein